ncbi:4'-phosphopantetheinyl transferase superfamily protein [Sphaerisporangium sp. TRM90804]|uniref:4'-phosphopantetheinyl transferase family protein n=1 Tax=Sphaerisporangium sp. TRM90804 TaxID=3031113 RepID=UPI00244CAA44|nr:4'-phosphopantetheinyl transferase superfamily protein [Sphaerisporangium sp. TRM90804]MDH2427527.1 4'-phosphopantetheinyl transferase superfamily protein [Sphaerisporangium sp. TRM90804]
MIESILPSYVASVDMFDDPADAPLFPEEEQIISAAVDKRRKEFTTARLCARRAMARLGVPAAPILPGLRGEPQWPKGVVGSMTHCAGYRGAVLALSTRATTIGVDAEPHEALPPGVLDAVSLPAEREHLRELSRRNRHVCWERLLFSAKESVYKAWFPLAQRWLDFEEVAIELDDDRRSFHARILVTGPWVNGAKLTGFSGRWLVRDRLILTAIVLPAPAPRPRAFPVLPPERPALPDPPAL